QHCLMKDRRPAEWGGPSSSLVGGSGLSGVARFFLLPLATPCHASHLRLPRWPAPTLRREGIIPRGALVMRRLPSRSAIAVPVEAALSASPVRRIGDRAVRGSCTLRRP